MRRAGFTLVELLIVIAVIGALVALLLPAMQRAREASRRLQCTHHMTQLAVAIHSYDLAFEAYPPGTVAAKGPVRHLPQGNHLNWIARLLPHLEQSNAYAQIDWNAGTYAPPNAPVRALTLSLLHCPSDPSSIAAGRTNYAGVHHHTEAAIDVTNSGAFILNRALRYRDIRDGAAQTLFVGEKRIGDDPKQDLGWLSGTRATLRNAGPTINFAPPNQLAAEVPMLPGLPGLDENGRPLEAEEVQEPAAAGSDAAGSDAAGSDAAAAQRSLAAAGSPDQQRLIREFERPAILADPAVGKPPPGLPVGGFSSSHSGGANFIFGDGRVTFLTESMALRVYRQLAHRADGLLLDSQWY